MSMKRTDMVLCIIAILLIAAGLVFRSRSVSGAGGGRTKIERVNLVFTQLRESELGEGAIAALIEEYEKLHPEISIIQQPRSYDEILDASTAAITVEAETASRGSGFSQDAPADIIAMDGRYLAEFIKTGFASLAPYLTPATPLEEWAIPLVSSIDVLFYNIDILKAAGFDRPPRNRAEFLRYAQAVSGGGTGAGKKYGAALALSPEDPRGIYRDVFSWIWASGALLIHGGAPEFGGSRITDTLSFLAQLNQEGLLAPQSFTATGQRRLDEFAAGKIAMMVGSVGDIAALSGRMGAGAFGVTLIPGPADYAGKPVFGLSVWYAGISRRSGHPREAWAFLLYLRENSARLAEQIRAVPGSSGSAAPYIESDPQYSKVWDLYEAADVVQEFTAFPKTRELENAVRDELAWMFAEHQSAAEAAAAVQKRWE
jgi:multiple sugar transport system substrate-binding protein